MAANKKPMTQTEDRTVRLTVDAVSKAGLADLVVDLLRRAAGDKSLDGDALVKAFLAAYKPIAAARGEKPPKVVTQRVFLHDPRGENVLAKVREDLRVQLGSSARCPACGKASATERGQLLFADASCGACDVESVKAARSGGER
jgi:hypothetical protein